MRPYPDFATQTSGEEDDNRGRNCRHRTRRPRLSEVNEKEEEDETTSNAIAVTHLWMPPRRHEVHEGFHHLIYYKFYTLKIAGYFASIYRG